MFWENAEDSHNQLVRSAMAVNRFEEILSIVHLADNTKLDFNDKMAKVRPTLSMLNERYLQFWTASQNGNVDESMIPYYGRHSAEQLEENQSVTDIKYGA
ncbi:PiggyBac transposable element-derived protein 3 [Elysia marginata]|uniref:PiggyBac transposable element-derived protein 3 n=1 Tax=Elysia marginata TaxID=1093978 RepID=A0AAV4IBX7_9GAST|nr:PiggyBac transposable element-derived protein 3 [Elysia marginata]